MKLLTFLKFNLWRPEGDGLFIYSSSHDTDDIGLMGYVVLQWQCICEETEYRNKGKSLDLDENKD